jgi:hypothetical protein
VGADVDDAVGGVTEVVHPEPLRPGDVADVVGDPGEDDHPLVQHVHPLDGGSQRQRGRLLRGMRVDGRARHSRHGRGPHLGDEVRQRALHLHPPDEVSSTAPNTTPTATSRPARQRHRARATVRTTADPIGPPPLDEEQEGQNCHRHGYGGALGARRDDLQTLDGGEHRDGRGDHAGAVEQRRSERPQDHDQCRAPRRATGQRTPCQRREGHPLMPPSAARSSCTTSPDTSSVTTEPDQPTPGQVLGRAAASGGIPGARSAPGTSPRATAPGAVFRLTPAAA